MPMILIQLLLLVLSYVLQFALQKRPKLKPAALEDWDFPKADEGEPQSVFFGDCWTDQPEVVWHGNYRTSKIKAGGKKG